MVSKIRSLESRSTASLLLLFPAYFSMERVIAFSFTSGILRAHAQKDKLLHVSSGEGGRLEEGGGQAHKGYFFGGVGGVRGVGVGGCTQKDPVLFWVDGGWW